MTQTERFLIGLLSGLLVVAGLLVWHWKQSIEYSYLVFSYLFPGGLLIAYGWWLYTKWAVRSWLAPAILLGCVLLTACADVRVYQRAKEISYTQDEGWISEMVYYTPEYDGEAEAFALIFISPLAGIILLWRCAAKGQRGWQFLHYFILLVTCYPLAMLLVFSSIGTKPRYYEGAQLPDTVADSLRIVRRGSPHTIYVTKH